MADRPGYRLVVGSREKDDNGRRRHNVVGAAWSRADGSIGIILNPGVVLDWRMCDQFYLSLFPEDDRHG